MGPLSKNFDFNIIQERIIKNSYEFSTHSRKFIRIFDDPFLNNIKKTKRAYLRLRKRRKEPILGYVPKNFEKKNSGVKKLKRLRRAHCTALQGVISSSPVYKKVNVSSRKVLSCSSRGLIYIIYIYLYIS